MIEKYRDISIINLGDQFITIACDSCGGVGLLEDDIVKTDGFNVGYHTAFVSLAETLAIGAEPLIIADTLSVSLGEYGKSIVSGIRAAAKEAGLNPDTSITGSSEENFTVKSTGIGVTVIGRLVLADFRPSAVSDTYDVIVIGHPFVGDDVLKNKPKLLTLQTVRILKNNNSVFDIIPVGSKGILYESNQMAGTLGMQFNEETSDPGMIRISAGPATCAIAAVTPGTAKKIKTLVNIPVTQIGTFIK